MILCNAIGPEPVGWDNVDRSDGAMPHPGILFHVVAMECNWFYLAGEFKNHIKPAVFGSAFNQLQQNIPGKLIF